MHYSPGDLEGGYVVAWAFMANGVCVAVGGKPEGELAVWTEVSQRSEWVKFDELKDLLAHLEREYKISNEYGDVRIAIEEGLEEWV